MKTTLTAIALSAVLATGASAISADMYVGGAAINAEMYGPTTVAYGSNQAGPLHIRDNEGYQNFAYYFGANCADRPVGPIAAAVPGIAAAGGCEAPCNTCAPRSVCVPMEPVCRTTSCNPCEGGGLFNIFG